MPPTQKHPVTPDWAPGFRFLRAQTKKGGPKGRPPV